MIRMSVRSGPNRVGDSRSSRAGMIYSLAILVASASAAEDYSTWAHQKDIYYNTAADGAGVSGSVLSFPVLVRLTAPDFPFAQALGNGQDLRFGKPDGTALPFEIDRYDSAAGLADVWVLADTVKGNSKGALMKVYWGKPAAPAASAPGQVFSRANGFAAVWHLGGRYQTARPNAVPGGSDAVTGNYDADEQVRGVIGYADSLDGGNPGDHLQTWQTFDSISTEFSFSVWAYPTSAAPWARFMDFGNGAGKDNVYLSRSYGGDSLHFETWNGSNASSLTTEGGTLALREWQLFAVTVAGKSVCIYRNGVKIAAGDLKDTLPALPRTSNFLGRSNWPADAYYQGMLDEPEVSAATRGPDWIKLAYANQKPNQTLLSFQAPIICAERFGVPGDTAVAEGTSLQFSAVADCADQFEWSWVSGPMVRLLDPEAKDLLVNLPRVAADTALVLRFSARFPDSVRSREVRIGIRNSVPDPVFTLPADLNWNGRDSLLIRPVIANLPAILASPFPALNLDWSLEGVQVDTIWKPSEGLVLLSARENGAVTVSLCLDNGEQPVCDSIKVNIEMTPTSVSRDLRIAASRDPLPPGYGPDGRMRSAPEDAVPRYAPASGRIPKRR